MTRLTSIAAALAVTGLTATAALAEKWDMPLAYPATNFHSVTAANFGKCVAGATNNKIEIVTHPAGSLFAGNDIKRAVQTGQAPIGERLLSAHQNENPLFGIDSIPFLATSFDDHEKLWSVAGPEVGKLLDSQNLVYLYSVPWPPQGLYFKKEVNSVADMRGIKFRSYNTATARLATLTGMLPVQIEAAELSQALATGVAESFISSGATGYDSKDAWNKLDAATQAAMKDCSSKAKAEGLKRAKDYTDFTLEGLKKGGMKVQRAGDQLVADLKKVGETMTEEWLKAAGERGQAVVKAYQAK